MTEKEKNTMVKRMVLGLLLFSLVFCGCSQGEQGGIRDAGEIEGLEVQDLQVQDGVISYTLYNGTADEIQIAGRYQLELQQDDLWHPVAMLTEIDGVEITFTDMVHCILPGSSVSEQHRLAYRGLETLQPGTYRILREAQIGSGDIRSGDWFYLSIPFSVS